MAMKKPKVIGVLALASIALMVVIVELYRAENAPGSGSTGMGEFWFVVIFIGVWLIVGVVRLLKKD